MSEHYDVRNLGVREGFTLSAHLEDDYDSTPYDADCYNDADIEAWKADKWRYVGVVVEARRAGILLGDASIWGTEHGRLSGQEVNAYDNGYLEDLISEAVINAKATLAKLQD